MREFVRAALLTALSIGLCRAEGAETWQESPLPLGNQGLTEHRSSRDAAPGVTVYTIERGWENPPSPWLVSAGVARNAQEKRDRVSCLLKAGLKARFQRYETPGSHPVPYVEVVSGRLESEKKAKAAASSAGDCGLKARAEAASALYGAASWRVFVTEIKPALFEGHLYSTRGGGLLSDKQTTSAIARHEQALLAINGGYFTKNPDDSMIGVSAGISVLNGRVASGPTKRPYLLLKDGKPVSASIIGASTEQLSLEWSDNSQTMVKGVNRRAGYVRGCGVGDQEPVHDETCTVPDDLVAIAAGPDFQVDSTGVVNFILHPDGKVDLAPTGDKSEILLAATGRTVETLSEKMRAGARATLDLGYGGQGVYAVNGAPSLLKDGLPSREEDSEGWATTSISRDRANFIHHWVGERNPRTAVGVSADGTIWLVVADGHENAFDKQIDASRKDNKSAGLTIEELRLVMRHLGARDAINLDGGGSSALVIDGALVSHPSDATGERAIGDAVVLTR